MNNQQKFVTILTVAIMIAVTAWGLGKNAKMNASAISMALIGNDAIQSVSGSLEYVPATVAFSGVFGGIK